MPTSIVFRISPSKKSGDRLINFAYGFFVGALVAGGINFLIGMIAKLPEPESTILNEQPNPQYKAFGKQGSRRTPKFQDDRKAWTAENENQ